MQGSPIAHVAPGRVDRLPQALTRAKPGRSSSLGVHGHSYKTLKPPTRSSHITFSGRGGSPSRPPSARAARDPSRPRVGRSRPGGCGAAPFGSVEGAIRSGCPAGRGWLAEGLVGARVRVALEAAQKLHVSAKACAPAVDPPHLPRSRVLPEEHPRPGALEVAHVEGGLKLGAGGFVRVHGPLSDEMIVNARLLCGGSSRRRC